MDADPESRTQAIRLNVEFEMWRRARGFLPSPVQRAALVRMNRHVRDTYGTLAGSDPGVE